MARRGAAMPKRAAEIGGDDRRGLHDQRARERCRHCLERDVHRHRHGAQLRAGQHHHRTWRGAGSGPGEFGQEFGVAGMGEAGGGQRRLLDGIGDDGGGAPSHDVSDGAADRLDHGGGVAGLAGPRLCGDRRGERGHRQRTRERHDSSSGVGLLDRAIDADGASPGAQEGGVGEEIERRQRQLTAPGPRHDRDVGPDTGGLAHGQGERQRRRHRLAHQW